MNRSDHRREARLATKPVRGQDTVATFRLQDVVEQAVKFLGRSDRVGGPVCYARTVPHGVFNLFDLAAAMLDVGEQGEDCYALSLTRPALNKHGMVVDLPDAVPTAMSIYTVPDAELIEAETGGVHHFRVRPPAGPASSLRWLTATSRCFTRR